MKKIALILIIIGQAFFSLTMAREHDCKKINFPYLGLEERGSVFTLETGINIFQEYVRPCPVLTKKGMAMLNQYLATEGEMPTQYMELLSIYQTMGRIEFVLMLEKVEEKNKGAVRILLSRVTAASKIHDKNRENNFFSAMRMVYQGLDAADHNELTDYILAQYRQDIHLYEFVPRLIETVDFHTEEKFVEGPTDNIVWATVNGVTLASMAIATLRGLNRLRKGDFTFIASIRRGGQWLGGLFSRGARPKGIPINNQKALPEAQVLEFPTTAPPITPPSTAGVTGGQRGPKIEVAPPPAPPPPTGAGGAAKSGEEAANTSLIVKGEGHKGPNDLQIAGERKRGFMEHPFWGNSHRQRRVRDYTIAGTVGLISGANYYRQEHLEEGYNSPMEQLRLVHENLLAEISLANKRDYQGSKQGSDINYFRENLPSIESRIETVTRLLLNGVERDDFNEAKMKMMNARLSATENMRRGPIPEAPKEVVDRSLNSTITTTREFKDGPFTLPIGSKISTAGMLANMGMWKQDVLKLEEEEAQERERNGENMLVDVLLDICVLEKERESEVWDEKSSSYLKKELEAIERHAKKLKEKFTDKDPYPITITRSEVRIVNDEGSVCRIEEGTMVGLYAVYGQLEDLSDKLKDALYRITILDASSLICELEESKLKRLNITSSIERINDLMVELNDLLDNEDESDSPIIIKEEHCDKKVGDIADNETELFYQLSKHRKDIKRTVLERGIKARCDLSDISNGITSNQSLDEQIQVDEQQRMYFIYNTNPQSQVNEQPKTSEELQISFIHDRLTKVVAPFMKTISSIIDPRLVTVDEDGNKEHWDWYTPFIHIPSSSYRECRTFISSGTELVNLEILFGSFGQWVNIALILADRQLKNLLASKPQLERSVMNKVEKEYRYIQEFAMQKPVLSISMLLSKGGYSSLQKHYERVRNYRERETYNEAIREAIGFICTLESGSDGSVDITLASDDYYLEGVNHNLSIMQKLSKKYPGMNIIIEENECLRPGDVVDERLKQVRDKIREGFFNRSADKLCEIKAIEFSKTMYIIDQINYFYNIFLDVKKIIKLMRIILDNRFPDESMAEAFQCGEHKLSWDKEYVNMRDLLKQFYLWIKDIRIHINQQLLNKGNELLLGREEDTKVDEIFDRQLIPEGI